jgi:3-oxoadipate enol-lactonase
LRSADRLQGPTDLRPLPSGELIELPDVAIWVRQMGQGEPVLCLSGLGYSSWCWEEFMARLAPEFHMIAMDNRGTGRSEKPPGPYWIEMMADDAVRVLEHLQAPPAHIVATSMGGYIALTMAKRHPDRIKSLVLVDTSKGGPGTRLVPEETYEAWHEASFMGARPFAERTMHFSFRQGYLENNPERFHEFLERRLEYPTPPMCWSAQNGACILFLEKGVDVSKIHQPALVIHGTDDRVLPFENGKILAEALPNATFVPFEGGGHLTFLEEPEKFAKLVLQFLNQQK